ncbi:MAG: VWA domain-containing protein [Trueperaceae bacterium]|nr:MAG: VWA domain-containing protein [Trueperaceae bacterium]
MFLWPWLLVLLAIVPILIWLYRRESELPAKSSILHSDLLLLGRSSLLGRSAKRHLTASVYLVGCVLALMALARPTAPIFSEVPHGGIILALDTSRSMQRNDIRPSRFEAARTALKTFVSELPQGTRVGLVTFGSYAHLNIALTDDHEQFLQEVDTIPLIRGTAIGEALLRSLEALAEAGPPGGDAEFGRLATIVLLSDGNNRSGIDPLEVLPTVKEQRVTVHTVGVGTRSRSQFDGGFGGAATFDETTLKTIAEETAGRYVFVDSAETLEGIYRELGRTVTWRWQRDEATALVALAAAGSLFLSLILAGVGRRVL